MYLARSKFHRSYNLSPKRVLMSVFLQQGVTSDLAHLTQEGHQWMVEVTQTLLAS